VLPTSYNSDPGAVLRFRTKIIGFLIFFICYFFFFSLFSSFLLSLRLTLSTGVIEWREGDFSLDSEVLAT
jgi:hypothetical protein